MRNLSDMPAAELRGKGKPAWLKRPLPSGDRFFRLKKDLEIRNLYTICQNARCPNMAECWKEQHATFLIMGNTCTRDCGFCSVAHGTPGPLDPREPEKILEMARIMRLRYLVITSVTRDDLEDGGSGHFAAVLNTLKENEKDLLVEVLIPDFQAELSHLDRVLGARPDVLNHNLETVRVRYSSINRHPDNYRKSLAVLRHSSRKGFLTKSGIMVGLGETRSEIQELFFDLRSAGVELITIGQYLQPTRRHVAVKKYYTPEEFRELKSSALATGFTAVESGPFVRSSYRAGFMYAQSQKARKRASAGPAHQGITREPHP